jgi:hypothetical protein
LFSNKMQVSQPLPEDGIARRSTFARAYGAPLRDNPGVLVTWFSDKAHFHVDAYMNPILDLRESKTCTAPKGSYSMVCIIQRWNIRSRVHRWWSLLMSASVCRVMNAPFLTGYYIPMNLGWSEQDGARLRFFHDSFEERERERERESCRIRIFLSLRKDFMATNLITLKPL